MKKKLKRLKKVKLRIPIGRPIRIKESKKIYKRLKKMKGKYLEED